VGWLASLRPSAHAAILLVVHSILLGWAATRHSPTVDEVGHLGAGLSHWHFHRFDLYRVNPPLVRSVATLPVYLLGPTLDWHSYSQDSSWRTEFDVGRDFFAANGEDSFRYLFVARWMCIPFSILGGYVCFLWATDLYGSRAGIVATALWCFCPNILAHSQMITPDAPATALGMAASYVFWKWLSNPSWKRSLLCGLLLGFAEISKTTWLILFAIWPVLWVIRIGRSWNELKSHARREALQLTFILGLGWYLINLAYGFEGSFTQLGHFAFESTVLKGTGSHEEIRNRFTNGWLGRIPVPLPKYYVLGIDSQKHEFERGYLSFLRGTWRDHGWWYYYVYALAIKTPIGNWCLLCLAIYRWRTVASRNWYNDVCLFLPACVVLTLVSSQTGFNHHLRYVLPVLPFMYVWISQLVAGDGSRKRILLPAVLLAWSVVSSMSVYPHSLSYFNEAVGGPRYGHAHLVDSNIDWGQDLLYLKAWLGEHQESRDIKLAYFGWCDPGVVGLKYSLPPRGGPFVRGSDPGPKPGLFAISVNFLRGHRFPVFNGSGGTEYLDLPYYAYFQMLEPVGMAGYSIYIYDVTPEEANRIRADLGYPLLQLDR